MQLQGKTALVAGAARNNGRVIALTFARAGADLVLVAQKSKDDLEQVARECEALGAKALPLLADLSDHEQVNRIVQSGLEHFGMVDVLVSGGEQARPVRAYQVARTGAGSLWHTGEPARAVQHTEQAAQPGMVRGQGR